MLSAAKSFMFLMNTVVFTTLASEEPAFSSTFFRFVIAWVVCSSIVCASIAPVAGLIGI